LKSFYRYYLPILVWLSLIITVPFLTRTGGFNRLPYHIDKPAHLIEFFILGFLIVRALYYGSGKKEMKQAVLTTVGIAIFIAGADELYQIYVPERFSSFYDFIFDLLGITGSQLLFWYTIKTKRLNK